MTLHTLTRLIQSLSGAEKRNFKMATAKQAGNKDYIDLFNIINKTTDIDHIKKEFARICPTASLVNTTRYLIKLITDSLVQTKIEKDNFFNILQNILRAKVLQERSLFEESRMVMQKVSRSAAHSQQHLLEYFASREELNYIANEQLNHISDELLTDFQMKARNLLRTLSNIQDHHSLLEVLKYRLVNSGKVISHQERKKLNDLMLSEMALITGKSKNSFAAQKLHLLFQSYFFTDIGDYQSALKTFRSLNNIFEQNMELLEKPPLDYLSALNGIMDSLNALRKYQEMAYYIEKTAQLDDTEYPEHFRYQVRKTITVYELAILAGEERFDEAIKKDTDVVRMYPAINEEKQWELYFYFSLVYFRTGQLKKAHAFINEGMQQLKFHTHLPICKAIRLLNIIIYYEKGDTEYLEYEIRSYRRKQHLLKCESLLFKFIHAWPDSKRKKIPAALHKNLETDIQQLTKDKYETQVLKYFDITGWLSNRLNNFYA